MASTTTLYTGGGMSQLQTLNAAWAKNTAASYPNLFPKLAGGQTPQIFWFGCCDSRVPETSLLGLLPGEVFVHRNIANLVNVDDLSLPAALQYAVEHVQVAHIIVCGHLKCGGVASACATTLVGIPEVDTWLGPLRALRYAHLSTLASLSSNDQQAALVKINVEHSVAKISAIPAVAAGISSGALQVHGVIYDVGTGLLNFLSGADVAEPTPDPPFYAFNYTWWFNITNSNCSPQAFMDVQSNAIQCNGPSGTYPNQHWKFVPTSDGAFTITTQGLPGSVATLDPKTLLVSMAPPLAGSAATQHFRASLNGPMWNFTCDFLPSTFSLDVDPGNPNLKMSNVQGPGWNFALHSLSKV